MILKRYLPALIAGAMLLGVLVGFLINTNLSPEGAKAAAGHLSIITDIFLRLIKMVIAPLVFTTLVVGIAHMEDSAAIGRVGIKTLGWFMLASLVSLTIGLIMVQLLQPGAGLAGTLALPPPDASTGVAAAGFTLKDFITHLVPSSIFDAMARNEILQIVVFSVFVGTAVAALDGKAPLLLSACEQAAAVMLKITSYVMVIAPLVVFAALASTIATSGLGIVLVYAKFIGGFYLSLGILWCVLIAVCFLAVGARVKGLIQTIREPVLLAFSTATSEAAYPYLLSGLPRFGIPRKIVSFVLPLGYSFNLDGSMMYCTFASLFIAQAYGIHLSIGQQIAMLALLMVTSKGIAGVPRASLVVIAATLPVFHLPEAGLLLIIGVDHLLDMGRSATNVVGNSVAAVIVSRWEKQLGAETEEDAVAAAA
ncbi:MAG: dicarboxylate/amino acid:cation symporter [Rhizomicrobium sp.]